MKRPFTLFAMMILIIIAVSCKSKMEKLENEVYSEKFTYDQNGMQKAQELMDLYLSKANANPKAKDAPDYLFKAAELAMNLEKTQQALDLYNKIIYTYPDFKKAPECLFLMAFINENTLKDYGKARELYELFLKKYPDHEFADDARFSLQYLGKSPEELMKHFEEQNKQAGDTVDM